jgi:hypothetical protein
VEIKIYKNFPLGRGRIQRIGHRGGKVEREKNYHLGQHHRFDPVRGGTYSGASGYTNERARNDNSKLKKKKIQNHQKKQRRKPRLAHIRLKLLNRDNDNNNTWNLQAKKGGIDKGIELAQEHNQHSSITYTMVQKSLAQKKKKKKKKKKRSWFC